MLGKAWNNLLRVGGLVDGATLIHPTRLKPIRIKPGDLRQKNHAPLRGAISEQQTSASAVIAPAIRYSMGDEHNTRNPKLLRLTGWK